MNRGRSGEEIFRRKETISTLVNQVMFFMLCERWFCPEERLTGLYSLLFYNVFGYLVSYASKLFEISKYSAIIRVSEHSNIKHLALTATKMVLDFTKAITFAITLVFMLLAFGLEQGLEHFNPTFPYIVLTAIYFVLTEKACQEKVPQILTRFEMDFFENLETFWCPFILRLVSSLASGIMIMLVWFFTDGGWILVFAASYVNILLVLKEMESSWKRLQNERFSQAFFLSKYRVASGKELKEWDDDCPVCLQTMRRARVTPCKHFFHGPCLRRCLKEKMSCPLCKQEL